MGSRSNNTAAGERQINDTVDVTHPGPVAYILALFIRCLGTILRAFSFLAGLVDLLVTLTAPRNVTTTSPVMRGRQAAAVQIERPAPAVDADPQMHLRHLPYILAVLLLAVAVAVCH
ncbi:hypothetical protein FRC12_004263 [Ceratobasidium sp. 428]|nr:hypothetical protein FRC12_004263 [Ceratobasidium sp. 428]